MEETAGRGGSPHLCYAGLGIMMFLFIFPSLMITMFQMEAPWGYLAAIQALYIIITSLYMAHILLDLAIMTWITASKVKLRTALAIFCPVLTAILSLPPMGMLVHTKSRDGFTSSSANAALLFSMLVIPLQLLHALFATWLYWTYRQHTTCCGFRSFPCCCLVDKAQEERVGLPSVSEHGDTPNQDTPPGYIHQVQSVHFHPSQAGVVFNTSDPNDAQRNNAGGVVVVPQAIPPPPSVPKRGASKSPDDVIGLAESESQPPGAQPHHLVSFPDMDNSQGDRAATALPPPPRVAASRQRRKLPEHPAEVAASDEAIRQRDVIESEDIDLGFDNKLYYAQNEQRSSDQETFRPETEVHFPTTVIHSSSDADV